MRFIVRETSWSIAGAAFLVVLIAASVFPPYYVTLLITVGLTAISASGLALLLSCGQASLGHAAYVGIGAYVAALLSRDAGVPTPIALLAGVLGAAGLALIIGAVTLRLKGHFLALATLTIGVAVPATIVAASSITGGASGLGEIPPLRIGPWPIVDQRLYAVLVWFAALAISGGFSRLARSRVGRAIAALRTSGELSCICGIEVPRLKMMVFVISAATAGLSGALYAFFYRYVSPAPFDLSASINLLIVCVVGGGGNAFGAVLGAIAVTAIEVTLQNVLARGLGLPGQVETLAFGVIMLVILMKWPKGLWALFEPYWPRTVPGKGTHRSSMSARDGGSESAPIMSVSNVTKAFDGLRALGGVSFDIHTNEVLGLIGPNGAGKSTTFNIVTGLLTPTAGTVTLAGRKLPKPSQLAAHGVTRTFQHVKLISELSVIENVVLGSFFNGRAGFLAGMFYGDAGEEGAAFSRAWHALEAVGLSDLATAPASQLAMGQARMVEIARAIIGQPRLLLLDEPAAGLRTSEKLRLVTLLHRLKRQGTSIMIVEHDMDLVMNSVDRVIVLDRGEGLASGPPAVVREDPRVIAAYLGA